MDIYALCCGLKPHSCLRDTLLLAAILSQVACATSWGYSDVQAHAAVEGHVYVYGRPTAWVCVDVCGPFYYREPCRLVPVGHAAATVTLI